MVETFADRLRKARDNRGLSQSELARETRMQPSAISHFEAGRRRPSFNNVRALASALRVSADYLLCAKPTQRSSPHGLRDLADKIEKVAREHPAYNQAQRIIDNATDHLTALAAYHEIIAATSNPPRDRP